jgi:hypothetical protein
MYTAMAEITERDVTVEMRRHAYGGRDEPPDWINLTRRTPSMPMAAVGATSPLGRLWVKDWIPPHLAAQWRGLERLVSHRIRPFAGL